MTNSDKPTVRRLSTKIQILWLWLLLKDEMLVLSIWPSENFDRRLLTWSPQSDWLTLEVLSYLFLVLRNVDVTFLFITNLQFNFYKREWLKGRKLKKKQKQEKQKEKLHWSLNSYFMGVVHLSLNSFSYGWISAGSSQGNVCLLLHYKLLTLSLKAIRLVSDYRENLIGTAFSSVLKNFGKLFLKSQWISL